MPRYFFHIWDRGRLIEDKEGLELPDLDAASEECRRMIREVLEEEQWHDDLTTDRMFQIVDEGGRVVLTVPFTTD